MRKPAAAILAIFALAALYLLAWPVPIDPVAWTAPEDEGFTGAFSENELLRAARGIDLGEHVGPEDVALGDDGYLYATTLSGAILKVSTDGRSITVVAEASGRPLGLEFDGDGSILVANAYTGVQRITLDGTVRNILTEVNGEPLVYADDLAVTKSGTIYVTQASWKFAARDFGGTLEGSLLDILEHGGNGRVIEYTPSDGKVRILIDGLNFANGIALGDDERYLLIAETGSYRILKHWLEGPRAGKTDVLIDNLPGFPDNINRGLNGRFWIGLVAPRNPFLDDYSAHPFVRKIAQRLPAALRPQPVMSSQVFAIDGDGEVLMFLDDPAAKYPMLTGAVETRSALYFSSLEGSVLPRLDKDDLL